MTFIVVPSWFVEHWTHRYGNFRVTVGEADKLKWLFHQEKATLLDLRYSTLTLQLPL
jgi:hypothetical protein